MGWKSTIDISRKEAIRLVFSRLADLNDMTNDELDSIIMSMGYGDNPDLSYYGHNFNII